MIKYKSISAVVLLLILLQGCSTCFYDHWEEQNNGYIRLTLTQGSNNLLPYHFEEATVIYPRNYDLKNNSSFASDFRIPINTSGDSVIIHFKRHNQTDSLLLTYQRSVERYDKCKSYNYYMFLNNVEVAYHSFDSISASVYNYAKTE